MTVENFKGVELTKLPDKYRIDYEDLACDKVALGFIIQDDVSEDYKFIHTAITLFCGFNTELLTQITKWIVLLNQGKEIIHA